MVGSSISSTRIPQIMPLISARAGLGAGASAKKVSESTPFWIRASSSSGAYPVSQQMTWSSSALLRPLRSTLVRYIG
jgi:hypothetical protein